MASRASGYQIDLYPEGAPVGSTPGRDGDHWRMGQELECVVAAVVVAVFPPLFGHFEAKAPMWTRMTRWLVYLAVLGIIDVVAGRPWTWVWIAGLPLLGATFHVAWCLRHDINPLTAEPRDRYEQLRGWA